MSSEIRVRFAPSPTGYLHVGGARTALFNYLFARRHGGTFLLRIEDTDRSRYQESALQEIFESLRWLGLSWDEGPETGGECGPYFQSQRLSIYHEHIRTLIDKGAAYRCFCTEERLTQLRAEQEARKLPTVSGYDRHCRDLPAAEVERLLAANTPHVIRFRIPQGRSVVFNDLIRGPIEYQSDILDDLVLIKSDGFPTYHFANIVDDHTMRISHVLRGDEWIASTPRHILLYEAFGWQPPIYAHMPVILSPTGGKLSKRKGAASVMDYQRGGYLPEALFNFLALLGWAPGDDREIMSRDEMIAGFTLEKVSPKAAVFDEKKLEWMNGQYLAQAEAGSLLPRVRGLWQDSGWLDTTAFDDAWLMQVIDLLKVRARKITELAENASYFFVDPAGYDPEAAKKAFAGDAAALLEAAAGLVQNATAFDHASLETLYRDYAQSREMSVGKLIHPTRLAISGVSAGPGLFEMMALLGKETVVRRMRSAINHMAIKNQ